MEKIKIAGTEYVITEPTFAVLDAIKNETGLDLALGVKDEAMKELTTDFKKLSRVIALILKNNENESFFEKHVDERQEFLYANGKLSDFVKVMGFFSKVLSGSVRDSQIPAQPKEEKVSQKTGKAKIKLVKKN